MNLTDDQLDTLENSAYDADAKTRSYSGRAMFGARCIAIEIDGINNLAKFFVSLAANDLTLAAKMASGVRTDSLGLGMIAYWPSIDAPEYFEVDEEF